MRTRALWGLLLGSCVLPAASAAAQPAPKEKQEAPRSYALDLLLAGQASLYVSDAMDDGGLFGGTALLRHSILAGGASFDVGGSLFETGVLNASLLGGLAWQTDLGVRLELLGAFGIDQYHAEDGGFLSEDPGTDATLGCAGARAGAWYRFAPRGTGHFTVGVFASYLQDFAQVTRRYSYLESPLFGPDTLVEAEHSFGGRRLAFAVTVGLSFDLLPR